MNASEERALLEAAARAAGIVISSWMLDGPDPSMRGAWLNDDEHSGDGWWNPLTDDGDALRLAVKLDMLTDSALTTSLMYASMDRDPLASTRLAITRAAAQMDPEKT